MAVFRMNRLGLVGALLFKSSLPQGCLAADDHISLAGPFSQDWVPAGALNHDPDHVCTEE